MACMEPVVEGLRISIEDPEAREFRAAVIEWLMTNHPHDCPVCDEGGECHLQDMTVMTQHNYRRYRFNKRTHKNQYLGPFINHEMNRCIACYRCVRYYRDYAGGKDLNVFSSRNRVYFGRQQDGILESEFSGNLIEICPTGVFTDKTFKQHYSRKWDLQTAPSVCVHCSLGCNIIAGERYGTLRRILNRYNGQVNGYFICDRGRFGYEFVNSNTRIKGTAWRRKGKLESVSKSEILDELRRQFTTGKKIIGIGSPRASMESNFALRTLVGFDNFYQGISDKEYNLIRTGLAILSRGSYRLPSLRECEQADAVLILGEDITNTAPMLDLAVRQAVRQQPMEDVRKLNIPAWNDAAARELIQDQHGPLFVATPEKTKLDEIATRTYRALPGQIARLGFAVAHLLDSQAPPPFVDLTADEKVLAAEITRCLQAAKNPLIIAGCSAGEESLVQAAANIAAALSPTEKKAGLFLIFNESNSVGLGLLAGKPLSQAAALKADILIILENDLYRRWDKEKVDNLFANSKQIIVLDHLETETSKKATILLPVSTFAEGSGTLVNNEGRAQRFFKVYPPAMDIQESWHWLGSIIQETGRNGSAHWENLDDLINELVKVLPALAEIKNLAPDANFRIGGEKIPRQSHRYSGRTSMNANINVSEPKPPQDPDSPFVFSMEGYYGAPPSGVIPLFWSPGWNSVQSLNKFQSEVGGPLRDGDPGLSLLQQGVEKSGYFAPERSTGNDRDGEWWIVALHHIFGSEELSAKAAAIIELIPAPYVLLNRQDSSKLKIKENDKILLEVGSLHIELPVRFSDHLAAGSIGYPVGLPNLPCLDLPARGKIAGIRQ